VPEPFHRRLRSISKEERAQGSFGTDSPNGSRVVERILTVVTTLRLQKRNVLDYLTAVCSAALHGETPPSLLPAYTMEA